MTEAIDLTGSIKYVAGVPFFLGLLTEAYLKIDEVEEALSALERSFEILDGSDRYMWIPELYRLKGEALSKSGDDVDEVQGCFEKALELARGQGARSLELRAATSLGRFWIEQGKTQQARALVRDVYDWFTEGFDTKDLKQAKSLLDQLG
jgi:tetratricopeptide (TPR) repeat protein